MKTLHYTTLFIILIFSSSSCLDVELKKNRVVLSSQLNGIWEEEDDDRYELVKVSDHLIYIYGENKTEGSPMYKFSISKIGGFQFATLLDLDEDRPYTLLVEELSNYRIALKSFSIIGMDDDEFDELNLSNKESVFTAMVEKYGVEDGDLDLNLVYSKIYEPILSP